MRWYWWMIIGAALTIGVQVLARIPRKDQDEEGQSASSKSLSDLIGYE